MVYFNEFFSEAENDSIDDWNPAALLTDVNGCICIRTQGYDLWFQLLTFFVHLFLRICFRSSHSRIAQFQSIKGNNDNTTFKVKCVISFYGSLAVSWQMELQLKAGLSFTNIIYDDFVDMAHILGRVYTWQKVLFSCYLRRLPTYFRYTTKNWWVKGQGCPYV